jgi:mannose-6-phosphate isomerase-like protein (cupin superfamily)
MEEPLQRGRLENPDDAPVSGERVVTLLERPGAVIEQILSGALPQPLDFDQDHDEWVVVLEGHARLGLDGRELELHAGDWLLIPAGQPHRVLETRPGTSWLAVHVRNQD